MFGTKYKLTKQNVKLLKFGQDRNVGSSLEQ